VLIVSLLFPLGSLFYGFVQQGKQHQDAGDLADDAVQQQRELQREEFKKQLAHIRGQKRAEQLRGIGGMVNAGRQGLNGANGAGTHDDGFSDLSGDASDFR
jgi:hypothetical protein